ncbi:MAG: DUF3568 family protein [Deltaproteobacteria bacterium]|nr:DUF3568 family protein [Deltaproteobacteria bacterium]
MNRRRTTLNGMILLAALVSLSLAPMGCSPTLVGENTAAYSMGKLHARIDREMNAVYEASVKALEALEIGVTEQKKDVFAARVAGKTADERTITIRMEPEGEASTLLSIRTGVIGGETEARARAIYDKIREILGQ